MQQLRVGKITRNKDGKYHFASTTLNWVSINLRSSLNGRNTTCGLPQIVDKTAVAMKRCLEILLQYLFLLLLVGCRSGF